MNYQLKNFTLKIENLKIKKIYFKDKIILSEVNFFSEQNEIVKKILKEQNLTNFTSLTKTFNFKNTFIVFKKNKYLSLNYESKIEEQNLFLNIEVIFSINKDDLILNVIFKSNQRFFWSVNTEFNFNKIDKEKIYLKNANKNIILNEKLNQIEKNKILNINKDYSISVNDIEIQTTYKNYQVIENKLIFYTQVLGSKKEILKNNQSLNKNKSTYAFRLKIK